MKPAALALVLCSLAAACSEEEAPAATAAPAEERSAPEAAPEPEPEGPEAQAVRDAFEGYRRALIEEDGEAAAARVSAGTLEAYQRFRDLALTGDRDALEELSMVHRMQVLLFRHRIDADALEAMDGRAAFAHAVDQAWVGAGGIERLEVHHVSVRGDQATANVGVGPAPSPDLFRFRREDGDWRFDLMPTLGAAEGALRQMAAARGVEANEFLLGMIGSMSGEPATEALFDPPR